MNQGEVWCCNTKSYVGVAGEEGWSKDGETEDVKPETASVKKLCEELDAEDFESKSHSRALIKCTGH